MTGMAYSPQKHAQDVQDLAEQIREFKRGQAIMLGHLERIEAMLTQDRSVKSPADPALNSLVPAAFECLGGAVWTLQDLLIAAAETTDAADRLSAVVSAIGKGNARSVGKFLATNVPLAYVTPDGLELRRCGADRNSIAWTIAQA